MAPTLINYATRPILKRLLPALVRAQRRLVRKLARLETWVAQEKEKRKQIDDLLIAEGFTRGQGVTCVGYHVVHRDRKGNTSVDTAAAEILFVLGGVDPEFVDFVLTTCTAVGESPKWAEITADPAALVRA